MGKAKSQPKRKRRTALDKAKLYIKDLLDANLQLEHTKNTQAREAERSVELDKSRRERIAELARENEQLMHRRQAAEKEIERFVRVVDQFTSISIVPHGTNLQQMAPTASSPSGLRKT